MFREFMDYIGIINFRNYVDIPGYGSKVLREWNVKNLITNNGRTLFITRIGNDTPAPVSHMAIGTGTNTPELTDPTLQTEKYRAPVTVSIQGTPNWYSVFSSIWTSEQINGSTEVGLLNAASGGTLCSRTKFTAISVPDGTNIAIDYTIGLITLSVVTGFTLTSGQTNTYEVPMPGSVAVRGVIESDTNNGYDKKSSIVTVESDSASYYHDTSTGKLYIHTSNNADPNTHVILVQSGG